VRVVSGLYFLINPVCQEKELSTLLRGPRAVARRDPLHPIHRRPATPRWCTTPERGAQAARARTPRGAHGRRLRPPIGSWWRGGGRTDADAGATSPGESPALRTKLFGGLERTASKAELPPGNGVGADDGEVHEDELDGVGEA
jgi:hypothetical protein